MLAAAADSSRRDTPGPARVLSNPHVRLSAIALLVRPRTPAGTPAEIILNPVTHACLGDRIWPVPGFHLPEGANEGAALVTMAFVNKVGRLP